MAVGFCLSQIDARIQKMGVADSLKEMSMMQQGVSKPVQRRPFWPLMLIGLAIFSTLALVDWNNTGMAKPVWMFFLPVAFGVLGGVIAFRNRAYTLACVSALLGLIALPLLNFVITLTCGP